MNLATIVIDPDEAKERCAEYEAALRLDRNTEDEAMFQGFRAAARGLPIIQLSKCIEAGGFFDNGLPRIAVARADTTICLGEWAWWNRGLYFHSGTEDEVNNRRNNRKAMVGRDHVRVRMEPPEAQRGQWNAGKTIVPSIPPRFRPKGRKLHGFHVLWEVEEWTKVPPVDPALIRHIRGDLWAVLAVWDLTELERAVLAQRA